MTDFLQKNRNKRNLFRRGGEGGIKLCFANLYCLATESYAFSTRLRTARLKNSPPDCFSLQRAPSQGSNPLLFQTKNICAAGAKSQKGGSEPKAL